MRGSIPTVVITADARTPVARAGDQVIDLGFADEESVVQTRFATTELALLRAHLGHDLSAAAEAAKQVLAEPSRRSCWPHASSPSSAPAGPTAWPTRRR